MRKRQITINIKFIAEKFKGIIYSTIKTHDFDENARISRGITLRVIQA